MAKRFLLWLFCYTVVCSSVCFAELRILHYNGFTLVVDCQQRAAVRFEYFVGPDTGNLERRSSYSTDPSFDTNCQQLQGSTYTNAPERFDRGHLVPANHLDNVAQGIYQSNYMTNILPLARNMKRGAWLLTEEIIECHRESGQLRVIGGALFDSNQSRDFFIPSHGVRTPSAFWKVIFTTDRHIAWIIPNVDGSRRSELDRFIVPLVEIEQATGEVFRLVDDHQKSVAPTTSWARPEDCDLT
jgi:endonuclease G, mitochondrial